VSDFNSVDAYDPTTNTWSQRAPMLGKSRIAYAAALGPDGRIYVAGRRPGLGDRRQIQHQPPPRRPGLVYHRRVSAPI